MHVFCELHCYFGRCTNIFEAKFDFEGKACYSFGFSQADSLTPVLLSGGDAEFTLIINPFIRDDDRIFYLTLTGKGGVQLWESKTVTIQHEGPERNILLSIAPLMEEKQKTGT